MGVRGLSHSLTEGGHREVLWEGALEASLRSYAKRVAETPSQRVRAS